MNAAAQAASAYAQGHLQAPVITPEHLEKVRRIALHLAARLPPNVEIDDLIQAGMIGLMDAVRLFKDGHGARFETYAGIRIRGAMIDELRRNDWAPRTVHRAMRQVTDAIRQIEQETGHEASEAGILQRLGMDADTYHEIIRDAVQCQVVSMSGAGDEDPVQDIASGADTPAEALENEAFQEAMATGIQQLPERERLLMSLYYDDELNLREIGAVLGITESRACQLHGQALLRLKARLADWRDGSAAAPAASPRRSRETKNPSSLLSTQRSGYAHENSHRG